MNVLNNANPTIGSKSNFSTNQESLSFLYAPAGGKLWNFEGSYTHSSLRSDIRFLDPEFLIPELSRLHGQQPHGDWPIQTNIPSAGV